MAFLIQETSTRALSRLLQHASFSFILLELPATNEIPIYMDMASVIPRRCNARQKLALIRRGKEMGGEGGEVQTTIYNDCL